MESHIGILSQKYFNTDESDLADIRIVDFGLRKIIWPEDFSTDPYGTLVKLS